ncbi:MAG: TAT-dependent nitrous-oxide reductase, partial [bacterium]
DVHHPVLSETDGKYDGEYLYTHDKANNRVAKVSLERFETEEIKNVPNIQGAHGIAVLSPNTEMLAVNGEYRHEVKSDVPNPDNYKSMVSFLDPETLETKFQLLIPGNADINDSSKDGKWMFSTVYNTEKGLTITEMIQNDEDAIAAMNIPAMKKAVENGEYEEINGIPVIDPTKTSNRVLRMLPVPKNPHGNDVDPTGQYVMGSGKLSPTVSVYDISKIDKVDNPEDALVAEPRVGLGPLHTTFDDRGNAYTSLFIDSQISKWDIEKAVQAHNGKDVNPIEDKIDVHYNVGHTQAMEAESMDPAGDYLLSLNKLSKDQYIPVGPSKPESQEIIDINDKSMNMVMSFPAEPEPHDAVFMRTKRLADKVAQKGEGKDHPDAVKQGNERVERTGPNSVHVYMTAVRSEFKPHTVKVKEGDKVTF